MIAIKDMEMPKNCAECPMYQSEDSDYCDITGEWITGEEMKRHKNCPLIEIVTCKDCKYARQNDDNDRYCDLSGRYYDPDYFCANGERRE